MILFFVFATNLNTTYRNRNTIVLGITQHLSPCWQQCCVQTRKNPKKSAAKPKYHNNIPPSFGERKKVIRSCFMVSRFGAKFHLKILTDFVFNFRCFEFHPDSEICDQTWILYNYSLLFPHCLCEDHAWIDMICEDAMQCLFSLSITTITASARAREL